MSDTLAKVGAYAFIVGVVIAVITAFIPPNWLPMAFVALALIGLVVGFLNVTEKETKEFLMASVAMLIALFTARSAVDMMAESFTAIGFGAVSNYMISLLASINMFIFPATLVVALKAIYALAKEE
ncbi:MAG: hypothetical protein QXK37_00550 [Candidatus Woesearchaeota archaeon]